jgi:hypothetical protein
MVCGWLVGWLLDRSIDRSIYVRVVLTDLWLCAPIETGIRSYRNQHPVIPRSPRFQRRAGIWKPLDCWNATRHSSSWWAILSVFYKTISLVLIWFPRVHIKKLAICSRACREMFSMPKPKRYGLLAMVKYVSTIRSTREPYTVLFETDINNNPNNWCSWWRLL